ncbi:MAG: UDP-2,3-diacylglucosamine diphosphatase [Burkholderiaceae bacterium]|jgi:UDP-2,3-diacylglucosamine hydrolase|nr:UDP-2,3-diacylglucosamine diphosphatase [Burkholderiaceae bacterium]
MSAADTAAAAIGLPAFHVLAAPANWQVADFIADLHLQAAQPRITRAWQRYLLSTPADAVFILGDLFEVWTGDDAARETGAFETHCADVLHAASARYSVHFMAGNRDFLVGNDFLQRCHIAALPDPTVLRMHGQHWLLSHGDALCLADAAYQEFRALVRSPRWQQQFLARPLPERRAMAQQMRQHSEAHKSASAYVPADVDAAAAIAWLRAANASTLIHGHTHQPGEHTLQAASGSAPPLRRVVLSDWRIESGQPRADLLRLDSTGLHRLSLQQASA